MITVKFMLKTFYINNQKGYVALMSSVVISALLIAITISLGFTGFLGRLNIVDSESKERSLALAEACADTAILNIAQDALYNPSNEVITVNSDQCKIISVATSGNEKTIKTQSEINKSYSNLKIVIDGAAFDIISWQECANFGESC